MTEHCPDCGSDECAALFWPNDLGATIGCLMRQLAATKAENEQLRSGELIRSCRGCACARCIQRIERGSL